MAWAAANEPRALEGYASLHVGVHRDAGVIRQVAADGADGQCVVAQTWLHCPASGPVTFRWGGDEAWQLVGDAEVAPGTTGRAWVLAPSGSNDAVVARISRGEATFIDVERWYLQTGDNEPLRPDLDLIKALEVLAKSPDWKVRVRAVRAMGPWARQSVGDVMPYGSPNPVPAGVLGRLAQDKDLRVRRVTAKVLREVKPGSELAEEASSALASLVVDKAPQVRKVALLSKVRTVAEDDPEASVVAWKRALAMVPQEGGPGRAACNSLAVLRPYLEDSDAIDAVGALDLVLKHHPERAWKYWASWKQVIPLDPHRAQVLFNETVGFSPSLVLFWGGEYPVELSETLLLWEPLPPHSERYALITVLLEEALDPTLRAVLDADEIDLEAIEAAKEQAAHPPVEQDPE